MFAFKSIRFSECHSKNKNKIKREKMQITEKHSLFIETIHTCS